MDDTHLELKVKFKIEAVTANILFSFPTLGGKNFNISSLNMMLATDTSVEIFIMYRVLLIFTVFYELS